MIYLFSCKNQQDTETIETQQKLIDSLKQQSEDKVSYLGIISKNTHRLSLFKIIEGKPKLLWEKGVFYPTGARCSITSATTTCPENAAEACGSDCQFTGLCLCVRNTMTSDEGTIYSYCWCKEDGPKMGDGDIPTDVTIYEL